MERETLKKAEERKNQWTREWNRERALLLINVIQRDNNVGFVRKKLGKNAIELLELFGQIVYAVLKSRQFFFEI